MSITGYGIVEFRHEGPAKDWWAAARLYFYGDVDVYAVLAHPWGDWEEGDGLLEPVVKPRGLPADLSLMALHATHRSVKDEEGRACTEKQAEKWPEGRIPGFFLDPKEWKCATYLSTYEVQKAATRYKNNSRSGRGSPEIAGPLFMMKAIEGNAPVGTKARLVLWFQ